VYEWLQAGASCFLIKNAPAEQLVEAIRVVAAGDSLRLDPGLLSLTLERVKLHLFQGSCTALTTRLELDYKGLDCEASKRGLLS
jgi:DNA-binding NarL/FixJ family response regulator